MSFWTIFNTSENKRIPNTIYVCLPVSQSSCKTPLQQAVYPVLKEFQYSDTGKRVGIYGTRLELKI